MLHHSEALKMKRIYFLEGRKISHREISLDSFILKRIFTNQYYIVYSKEDEENKIFAIYNKKGKRYLKKILKNLLNDILEETEVDFIHYNK